MASGSNSTSEPRPKSCINKSAAVAPGTPSRLCTGALVAWLSEGSCSDQVASASPPLTARLRSAIPPNSRSRRCKATPRWPDREAIPSRLRSINDIADSSLYACTFLKTGFCLRDRALAEHLYQTMQCLGGNLFVLHHGDADVIGARIAAVHLLPRQIAAGNHAQAALTP